MALPGTLVEEFYGTCKIAFFPQFMREVVSYCLRILLSGRTGWVATRHCC